MCKSFSQKRITCISTNQPPVDRQFVTNGSILISCLTSITSWFDVTPFPVHLAIAAIGRREPETVVTGVNCHAGVTCVVRKCHVAVIDVRKHRTIFGYIINNCIIVR